MYIEFNTPSNWSEKEVAKRINDLIAGSNINYYQGDNGHWKLGGNDWFLELENQDERIQRFRLSYRYMLNEEDSKALLKTIIFLLRIKDINK